MSGIAFPATRWSLIARLPDQPEAAGVLVGLYADAVATYLRLKFSHEAPDRVEDAVQEVLLHLLARPEVVAKAAPGPGSRFRHYVMHLAWHTAMNHLRHARRRDAAPLPEQAAAADAAPAADAAMDRAWAQSVLRQSLDEVRRWDADGILEPGSAAILEGSLVEGRPLRAIAAEQGVSAATCCRRLAAARQRLQAAIAARLVAAGELAPGDDPAAACAVLLDRLAG
ncbi:MAG: hypothetical protein RLZZ127_1847 [Planctomycetota bacterium]